MLLLDWEVLGFVVVLPNLASGMQADRMTVSGELVLLNFSGLCLQDASLKKYWTFLVLMRDQKNFAWEVDKCWKPL